MIGRLMEGPIDLLSNPLPCKAVCKELGWSGFHSLLGIFYHSIGLFLIQFASIMPEYISTALNILIFWLEVLIRVISLLQIGVLFVIYNKLPLQTSICWNKFSHLLFLIISTWLYFAFLTSLVIGLKSLFLSFFFHEIACIRMVVLSSMASEPIPSVSPGSLLKMQLPGVA